MMNRKTRKTAHWWALLTRCLDNVNQGPALLTATRRRWKRRPIKLRVTQGDRADNWGIGEEGTGNSRVTRTITGLQGQRGEILFSACDWWGINSCQGGQIWGLKWVRLARKETHTGLCTRIWSSKRTEIFIIFNFG